ncbi:MAG: DUF4037 domain-containing protein [Armatimonadota bacterium]|jgi:hypothetical protein
MSNATAYVERVVMPLIAEQHPRAAAEMRLVLIGSHVMGLDDEHSDLDAILYLGDEMWAAEGARLQLLLLHIPERFDAQLICSESPGHPEDWHIRGHPEICVLPRSWLLDGKAERILAQQDDVAWEDITFESLHTLHYESLVLRDSDDVIARLRKATLPERHPEWLWQKRLITTLARMKGMPAELDLAVRRHALVEAQILLGTLLGDLLKVGFLMCRQYHPYAKRLRWEYGRLPLPPDLPALIDVVAASADWREKVEAEHRALGRYTDIILEQRLLGPEVLEYLSPAHGYGAWSDPDWLSRVREQERAAKQAGYPAADRWVWSLWGEVRREK